MAKVKGDLLERLVPVLLVASLLLAFAVGMLWQKVSNLEGGKTAGTTANGAIPTANPNQQPGQGLNQLGKLSDDQASKIPQVTDKDHQRGASNPKVTLIEYSDFECPYCAQFHPTAQKLLQEYSEMAWVYRHFPLDQIHPDARPAANASECISALGGNTAFWKFADEVFPNQQTALKDLAGSAVKAGVDKTAFQSCLDAKKYDSIVDSDYQGGVTAGVTGTPGNFIVNDKGEVWFIPGALPYEQIKQVVDEALKSS